MRYLKPVEVYICPKTGKLVQDNKECKSCRYFKGALDGMKANGPFSAPMKRRPHQKLASDLKGGPIKNEA